MKLLDSERFRTPCGMHLHYAVFAIAFAEILLCVCGLVGLIVMQINPQVRMWPYTFLLIDILTCILLIYGNQTKHRHCYWPYIFAHSMFICLNTVASIGVMYKGIHHAVHPHNEPAHSEDQKTFNILAFLFFGAICFLVNTLMAYILWTVYQGYKYVGHEKVHLIRLYFPKLSTILSPHQTQPSHDHVRIQQKASIQIHSHEKETHEPQITVNVV